MALDIVGQYIYIHYRWKFESGFCTTIPLKVAYILMYMIISLDECGCRYSRPVYVLLSELRVLFDESNVEHRRGNKKSTVCG